VKGGRLREGGYGSIGNETKEWERVSEGMRRVGGGMKMVEQ